MFQKEESCDIIRMHLYTRPSKSTITAEEWRMMWKCPVCRYENKITETVYELPVFTGGYKFFRLLKK